MRLYLFIFALGIATLFSVQSHTNGRQRSSGAAQVAEKEVVIFKGISMLPGIRDGEKLTIERFDCRGGEFDIKRGDVVAFWFPDDPSKSYVKRLIGLPGETVQVSEERVFINGEKLAEPYVDPKLNVQDDDRPPVFVKPHYYYVLGDNRDNSSDSRAWGLVPEKYIYAKVVNR